jgi:hypothetical protein
MPNERERDKKCQNFGFKMLTTAYRKVKKPVCVSKFSIVSDICPMKGREIKSVKILVYKINDV